MKNCKLFETKHCFLNYKINQSFKLIFFQLQAKQFTKTITAKREFGDEEDDEPQESSSTYIFIPHSTLLSKQYRRDNTIFLDINIQKNNKLETSL